MRPILLSQFKPNELSKFETCVYKGQEPFPLQNVVGIKSELSGTEKAWNTRPSPTKSPGNLKSATSLPGLLLLQFGSIWLVWISVLRVVQRPPYNAANADFSCRILREADAQSEIAITCRTVLTVKKRVILWWTHSFFIHIMDFLQYWSAGLPVKLWEPTMNAENFVCDNKFSEVSPPDSCRRNYTFPWIHHAHAVTRIHAIHTYAGRDAAERDCGIVGGFGAGGWQLFSLFIFDLSRPRRTQRVLDVRLPRL